MGEFRMPSLGADMEYGTLVEWLVHEGDSVKRGDVIAVVDTDKSTIDVEVFDTGVVAELLVQPGERVPVGALLAQLSPAPGAGADVAPPVPASPVRHAPPVSSPLIRRDAAVRHVDLETVEGSGPGGRILRQDLPAPRRPATEEAGRPQRPSRQLRRASPYARRLAAESRLDLAALTGTGPGGAVVAQDVLAAAVTPPVDHRIVAPADRARVMRQHIADVMSRAHREIPQYHLTLTIDVDDTLAALRTRNEQHPPTERILPAALLLQASARAAGEVPGFNGHYVDDAYQPADDVHLGVAVAMRGGGLIVPVLRHADQLDLATLMRSLHELVGRARAGRLRSSDLAGATVTVTDLGERSVDSVAGIIHRPQVAIIGFGQIVVRPWVVDDRIVARALLTATLTADHRVTDGHDGARLLQAIERHLHDWEDSDDT